MNFSCKTFLFSCVLLLIASGCTKEAKPIKVDPEVFHKSVDKVTEIMIHDIFSPPVASRVYAYPNIAAYEIMALNNEGYLSLSNQAKELTQIPLPDSSKQINHALAAIIAHIDMSKRLIFSEKRLESFRDSLYHVWEAQNEQEFNNSKEYGLKVAAHIATWMDKDNYNQTRTMPKFTVDTDDPTRWQPTPPAYMDGIEPHWNKIRPFVIDSASQFKPVPPPPFSMEEGTEFYNEVKEVYDISMNIAKEGDDSEEIAIAQFWDCNPYVSVTRGHLMFATKKYLQVHIG